MNLKELKFLELFEELCKLNIVSDKLSFIKLVKRFLDLDYAYAVNAWEYLSITRENLFLRDEKLCEVIGFEMFNQFFARNSLKCAKVIADVPAIRRAVYQYTKQAGDENSLVIIVELLASSKIDKAEEILKCLLKNSFIHYGLTIRRIVEKAFVAIANKNKGKVVLNKKLTGLLLEYIKKIKTQEKAMLEQRIKELL